MALHASEAMGLAYGYNNIRRLSKLGYGNSRVTGLTDVASLIADIQTFRDLVSTKMADRPICDAAVDSVQWAANNDLLDTTIVGLLETVDDTTVSATTDLGFNFRGHAAFPTGAAAAGASDLNVFQPAQ